MKKKATRMRAAPGRRTDLILLAAALLISGLLLLGGILGSPQDTARAQGSVVHTSPQQNYDLSWYTVDGGGHTWSTGGTYTLGGTIGQPDAGLLATGNYSLGGGFWEGGAIVQMQHQIYLPLLLRSHAP